MDKTTSEIDTSKIINIKTDEGYSIKTLLELLYNVFTDINLNITKNSIEMCDINKGKNILIQFCLYKKFFNEFKIKEEKKFSIESIKISEITKNIKKKDNIYICINKEDNIRIKIKDGNNKKININKNISHYKNNDTFEPPDENLYKDYTPTCCISSSDFHKLCKNMVNVDKSVNIKAQEKGICFSVNNVTLGSNNSFYGKWNKENEILFDKNYSTTALSSIIKCCTLPYSKKIHIYAIKNLPLRINCSIGSIGEINIYITNI